MKMIQRLSLLLLVTLFISCMNFEEEELYGHWESDTHAFTFNEDKSMTWRQGDLTETGRFRIFGNTLEIIGSNEKVLTRVTVKSLEGDTLVIDLPAIESRVFTLQRADKPSSSDKDASESDPTH